MVFGLCPSFGVGIVRALEVRVMPSMPHEAPLFLFRERPELAAELLRDALGVEVPPHAHARVEESDFTQLVPSAYHADLVITLANEAPVMGIVIETQLAAKAEKRFVWPLYAAALHARLKCLTCLVIVVPTDDLARWASEPIATFQPGSPFIPIVLGPARVPVVTSEAEAERSPERAVLSALAHGQGEHAFAVAAAALGAAGRLIDDPRRALYIDLILSGLGASVRAALELKMDLSNYEFKSEFFRTKLESAISAGKAQGLAEGKAQGLAEGRAEGKAGALLDFLSARGLVVSDPLRARILQCTDLAQIDRWVVRAATAASADDVIGED